MKCSIRNVVLLICLAQGTPLRDNTNPELSARCSKRAHADAYQAPLHSYHSITAETTLVRLPASCFAQQRLVRS